jgi:hypothetical protein
MSRSPTLKAAALMLGLACGLAAAQSPVMKERAKKAAPPRSVTKSAPKPPAPAPLAPASQEQLEAASMAHAGQYACEFGQAVAVEATQGSAGYLTVRHQRDTWVMKPVLSQTGALRLEDVKGRMLLLQIANKSMLMDTKIGQRVVDNCIHEKQRAAANAPHESLGIEAPKAASAPA